MTAIQKNRNFGFRDKNAEAGFQEFTEAIGEDNHWFSILLQRVHEIKQLRQITDIVIRENQLIRLGTNKMFVPFLMKIGNRIFQPTDKHLHKLVAAVTGKDTEEVEKVSNYDFDIAIYGNGVYRANYSHDYMGWALVIRCLDFEILDFESLLYPPHYKQMIRSLVTELDIPNFTNMDARTNQDLTLGYIAGGALILHCGPTGKGKSTAMSSEINYLANRVNGMVMTYEDPIEQRFLQTRAIVRQLRLGEDIRAEGVLTLFDMLEHNLFRNNPSVVMISEVRTLREIYQLLDVANRGHAVFASMHAKNNAEALTTLNAAAGENKMLLSSALQAVVSHELYYTQAGKLVPIYEVFIPDKVMKTHLAKGDLQKINRAFYQENRNGSLIPGSLTFSQHIEWLIRNGSIPEEEFGRLTGSMRSAIWDYDEFIENRQSYAKVKRSA